MLASGLPGSGFVASGLPGSGSLGSDFVGPGLPGSDFLASGLPASGPVEVPGPRVAARTDGGRRYGRVASGSRSGSDSVFLGTRFGISSFAGSGSGFGSGRSAVGASGVFGGAVGPAPGAAGPSARSAATASWPITAVGAPCCSGVRVPGPELGGAAPVDFGRLTVAFGAGSFFGGGAAAGSGFGSTTSGVAASSFSGGSTSGVVVSAGGASPPGGRVPERRFFLRIRPVREARSGISPVERLRIRPLLPAPAGRSPVSRFRAPIRPLRLAWLGSSPVVRRFFLRIRSPVVGDRVPSLRRRFFLRGALSSTWRTVSNSSASTSRLVRSMASSSSMGGGASSTGLGGGGEGTNSRIRNR